MKKKGNKFAQGFILFFCITFFLAPIIVLFFIITMGESISFGLFISFIVSLITSGYLLRLYLWNQYGKEVFIIQQNDLISYYDYKYFKDNYRKEHFESIRIYFTHKGRKVNASKSLDNIEEIKSKYSIICFNLNGKDIKSIGKIPVEVIINIAKKAAVQ